MDDIRNHDATPTREESEWISTDVVALIVRSVGLAGLALAIGVAGSVIVAPAQTVAPQAAATPP